MDSSKIINLTNLTSEIFSERYQINWELKSFETILAVGNDIFIRSLKYDFELGKSIGVPSKWVLFFEKTKVTNNQNKAWELGLFLRLEENTSNIGQVDKQVFAQFEATITRSNGSIVYTAKSNALNFVESSIPSSSTTFCSSCRNGQGWDSSGCCHYCRNQTRPKTTTYEAHGWKDFIDKALAQDDPFVDGSLLIRVDFVLYGPQTHSSTVKQNNLTSLQNISYVKFGQDLMSMLTSGIFSDCTLHTNDRKEFKVHKIILSVRSPVFFAMFENQMKESETGLVIVEDMSGPTMEVMLRYIYSGGLNWFETLTNEDGPSTILEYADLAEMINAADKYNLPHLKEFCDKTVILACNPENALDLLKLAKLYSLDTAIIDISEYLQENISGVIQTIQ